jgi:hypothetical protein
MTPSTIVGVPAPSAAATEAVEALASAAVARLHDAGGHASDGSAFGRVLADERGAAEPYPAHDGDHEAAAPREAGRHERTSAASSQPEPAHHDDPAAGRAREDRDPAAVGRTTPARADGTTAAGASDDTKDPTAVGEGGTPDGTTGTASGATGVADSTGAPTGTEEATGSGGRSHKRLATAEPTVPTGVPPSTTAVVNPALTTAADAKPAANGDPDLQRARGTSAPAPVVPATPSAAPDGASDPGIPADREPKAVATPVPADPTATLSTSTPMISATTPAGRTPGAGETVAGAPAQPVPPAGVDADPVAIPPSGASSAAVPDAQAAAADGDRMVAVLPVAPAATGAARRDGRGRPVTAPVEASTTRARDGATTTGAAAASPTAASDVARARASIARITAARVDDAADERRPDAGAKPAVAATPSAPATQAGPSADAALAAIAAARGSGSPAAGPATQVSPTAATTALAADRVAFEAIDRITTTVMAGVPGLESRIDDPELGTIRIVVSARLGETIRAEIVARDPAAARELASGIDRALAAGATLPGNMDLRVRAEGAMPAARADTHLGSGAGGQSGPQDQPSSGAFTDAGGHTPGRDADGGVLSHVLAPAPAQGRGRGLGAVPVAIPSTTGSAHPGTALDVRA